MSYSQDPVSPNSAAQISPPSLLCPSNMYYLSRGPRFSKPPKLNTSPSAHGVMHDISSTAVPRPFALDARAPWDSGDEQIRMRNTDDTKRAKPGRSKEGGDDAQSPRPTPLGDTRRKRGRLARPTPTQIDETEITREKPLLSSSASAHTDMMS